MTEPSKATGFPNARLTESGTAVVKDKRSVPGALGGASFSERAMRGFAGTVLARPWFDRATLLGLKHGFFPASRLWAAARDASSDTDRFFAAVPLPVRHEIKPKLSLALARFEEARAAANAIEAEWQRTFFGKQEISADYCRAVEGARLRLRHGYNATRWQFRRLLRGAVPRVKLNVETPEAVEAIHGGGRDAFVARCAPPSAMPPVEVSRILELASQRDYWLRFPSPHARIGDTVYARVHEPLDAIDPPTVIFGHGICVEYDHWKGLIDESRALVAKGFRVIKPEAPWHGRRVYPGSFGGEHTIATFPMGMLDSFSAAVQEWSVLADWARRYSSAPLVFGGSSLGAMTSQFAATCSTLWRQDLRPDALFLITHTGDMAAAVMEGALATMWASPEEIERKGWTRELTRQFLSLVNPVGALPMPARQVVSILGRRDTVLPFESGRQLVASWGVPQENAFVWDRGHFSVPPTLIRTTAPIDRLAEIVQSIS